MSSVKCHSATPDITPPPTRDTDYYFEKDDCIIRAENCLFKIHRFLLERDSPIFQDLFSLPQTSSASEHVHSGISTIRGEGESDENPVICHDTADDFRALCWALYARPKDIDAQRTTSADLVQMARLLAISHKYQIEHLCDWCWSVIGTKAAQVFQHLTSSSDQGWKETERLLNLSIQSQQARLAKALEEDWLRKIQSTNIADSQMALRAALDAAERSAGTLRQFHGKAYYMYIKNVMMLHSSSESPIEVGNSAAFVNLDTSVLSELRCHRLCQGLWTLAQLSMKLLAAVPRLNDNASCTDHSSICIPTWNTWWKVKSTGLPVQTHYDPRVLIESMQNLANSDGDSFSNPRARYDCYLRRTVMEQIPIPCKASVLDQLKEMTKILDDTLADYFMLPHD
ncbi:hypothetical protein AN958_06360 [Leucoagaricus sp. SymC.cos]|nr:hypothetical protein AN958_06360 [Leucoagaricus sp. SymC.cos]